MKYDERAFMFDCAGEQSIGVASIPLDHAQPQVGILIVVGGPQYRVGSHRLFVRLARHAASHGLAAMRFDYRGMGDSWADIRTFDSVDADLRSAMDAFVKQVPSLKKVVVWGLCDGASAASLYAPLDERVSGLILINPWVHVPERAADTRLRHYYLERLFSAALWRKILIDRRFPSVASFKVLLQTLTRFMFTRVKRVFCRAKHTSADQLPLPDRTGYQVLRSRVPFAIALSDDDVIAREFESLALPTMAWQKAVNNQMVEMVPLDDADHTITSPEARDRLCELTVAWVRNICSARLTAWFLAVLSFLMRAPEDSWVIMI